MKAINSNSHTLNAALMRVVTVICLVSALGISLAFAFYSRNTIHKNADERLLIAVEFAHELQGVSFHDRIVGDDSLSREQFMRLLDRNDDLCRRLGLQYIWSVLVLEDRIVFTSATRSDIHDPTSAHASFYEAHSDPGAFDAAMGTPGIPVYSSFHNEWGEGRQVLVPRLDSQQRRYITGASIQLDELNSLVISAVWLALIAGAALFVPVWLIASRLTRRITGVFSQINTAAVQMKEGNLDVPLPVSGIAEARQVCDTLDSMRRELKGRMEELRESEERLDLAMAAKNEGIWDWNLVSNETVFDDRYYTMAGYTPKEFPQNFAAWAEHVHSDDLPLCDAAIKAYLSGQSERYDVAFRFKHKDGSWIWIQGRGRIVERDHNGAPLRMVGAHTDITERKQAEESLRESEAFYRSLVENLSQCILRKDLEGRFTFVDSNFCQLLDRTSEEIIGKTDFDIYPKELAEKYHADDVYVVENNNAFECVEDNIHPTGVKRYVQVLKTPLHDAFGKVTGIQCIFSDITDRKIYEEKLALSERTYREIFDNIPDALFIHEIDTGAIVDVNDTMLAMFGYKREEMLDVTVADFSALVEPYTNEHAGELIQKAASGETVVFEWLNRKKSGEFFFSENILKFVNIAGTDRIMAIVRDITDRKKVEESLQNERAQLLSVFNSIDHPIYIADTETHEILYVNRYLDNVLPGNCIGAKCYQALQGLDAPCSFCTNDIILKQNPDTHRWEFYNSKLDRHYDVVDRIIRWPDGRDVRFEMAVDISEAKRIQAVIDAKNKELEQLVYVASHDLRSPLVNVDGFSRELEYSIKELTALLDGGEAKDGLEQALRAEFPDMEKSIGRIRASTSQMDKLLKGLLKLSRQGRVALRIETLAMDDLLGKLASSFAFRIKEKSIELTVEKLPPCRGDAVQVTQVFSNLIDNAIKYRDKERRCVITVSGSAEGGRVRYRVEDNGIGIPENHREKIFELFHRFNPKETEGEGLGLTMVRQVLGRMDGEITVESKLGEGSVFIVSLPGVKENR